MQMKRIIICILICAVLLPMLCSCAQEKGEPEDKLSIGAMRGPTAMGMVKLMRDGADKYDFSLQTEAAAFVTALTKGEIDIAAVPANLAAVIYNNTDGKVRLLAVNTLNVLYIVGRDESIKSLSDLEGKKLYATGEAAVPEYVLRYILESNGLGADIQWCSDTTEVLSYISSDGDALAMLPQPFVSAAQLQTEGLKILIDLGEEWKKLQPDSDIITGVIVARSELISEQPDRVEEFLREYEASVGFVTANTQAAAELIGEYEIVKAPIAEKALPYCGITYMSGEEMKQKVSNFLSVLYGSDPKAVGGKMPDDGFYYGT